MRKKRTREQREAYVESFRYQARETVAELNRIPEKAWTDQDYSRWNWAHNMLWMISAELIEERQ